jgi:hypothetical protein
MRCTPFKALYGYDPNVAAAPMVQPTKHKSVQQLLTEPKLHIELIKQHLTTAQNRIKIQANKNCIDPEFHVGDKFFSELQPYAQESMVNRSFP